MAAGIGGLHTFEEEAGYYALNADKGPKYNPFFIPKMIADIASGHISMEYGYHGPNYGVVSAFSRCGLRAVVACRQGVHRVEASHAGREYGCFGTTGNDGVGLAEADKVESIDYGIVA